MGKYWVNWWDYCTINQLKQQFELSTPFDICTTPSFLCDISMNKKRNIKEIVERKTITMKIYQNIVYLYIIIIM